MFLCRLLTLLVLLPWTTLAWPAGTSTIPESKKVLVFSEMGPSAPATGLMLQQIQSQLSQTADYQVEFYVENLETTLFPDPRDQRDLRNWYLQRYGSKRIDVIVAAGPEPIRFISETRESLFPSVPVVICCSLIAQVKDLPPDSRLTGGWITADPQGTVDAALKLIPNARHLVIVSGSSAYDKGVLEAISQPLQIYAGKYDLTYLTDLSMPDLLRRLQNLPADTVVLYVSFCQDATGRHFLNATTALPMIAAASSAPLFGMSETYVGHGIVGGHVVSFADQGKMVAQALRDILKGKRPDQIPLQTTPNQYLFDWRQLQRWQLDEGRLPANSTVMFRELSLWQEYSGRLALISVLFLALMGLAVYLLLEIRKRGLAERERLELTRRLIHIQEEERRRIGREIHDDFSQRLAALAYQLEEIEDAADGSLVKVKPKLHALWEGVSEFGADLHALSHRLHSSVLDNLGLEAGLESLCREFGEKNGMDIEFATAEIPGPVPSETALCFFRITQEALRNARKHSGTSKAKVRLDILEEKLHLAVSDQGRGFALKGSSRHGGLGIRSMEERARLVGGHVAVHSRVGQGTLIEVMVPFRAYKTDPMKPGLRSAPRE